MFPPATSNLVKSPGLPANIDVGQNITYECAGGLRFVDDVHKVATDGVECIGGTNWDEPVEWDQCVDSEFYGPKISQQILTVLRF